MAGRKPIKCYEYDPDGKYLREFESYQHVRNTYFPEDTGKRPLFKSKKDYLKLSNGNFIANYRIGQSNLKKLERIRTCKYCSTNKNINNTAVEVFNLKGEKIAEFKNFYIASLMTGIDKTVLWSRLNSKSTITPNRDNLEFKYKTP